ncbi:ScbA/BarX family gamma-butyrolactone biosynthesis protein [Streptomyces sp. NPDC051219]|uniref:ScbA/BarX family gamma-butyrolactone biosynthesis protein n=1 Tax=Streptomyces sp. NPDC051219 TaxID=3155283 RepID=UPI00342BE6D0
MPEAAVLFNPAPMANPESQTAHPVPMEMVHRTKAEDAFPRSWIRKSRDRFSVAAVLPHDHPFFAPVHGDRHDPLLIAETMRQAAMLAFHAGYGVPLGYHFLMANLDYTCHMDHLRVGDAPAEIDVEVVCSELKWRGGQPVQGQVDWTVRRAGRLVATGAGATRFTSPQVYRRMRGDFAFPGTSIPVTTPVSPARAGRGRGRGEDVVLSESLQENVWQLRVDTRHSTLFQRPNDHVPGMLLLEAARQAACLVAGPVPFVPVAGGTRFHRYAEFNRPCWIQATVKPSGVPGMTTTQVTGHQDGNLVFFTTLTSPAFTG